VDIRLCIDPSTGEPHLVRHGVSKAEVEEILARPLEDRVGAEGARIAIGRTQAGRYLRVVYVPDPSPNSVFVITAYDLGAKARRALMRRRKKKR
jgi:hypothetical protein